MQSLNPELFGNSLVTWLISAGVGVGTYILLRLFKLALPKRLGKMAEKTSFKLDDFIIAQIRDKTRSFFLISLSIYIGSIFLTLPEKLSWAIRAVAIVALFVQIAIWGNEAIGWFLLKTERKEGIDGEGLVTYTAIAFAAKLVLWALILLLTLHNLGVNVTALVASLGIGGVAVALALQSVLGDIFASMSIVLDKPFEVGDFIIVDALMGTVEHVGLKTTRVRSLSGEQIVFSNTDLLGSRIRNYKRMQERRIAFSLGVVYDTAQEKLESVPAIIEEIIESQEMARFDRAHFNQFGDFSLNFEVVYFVKVPDYNTYMDIQQDINLAIYRRFSEEGIEFAYPTQTLFLEGGDRPDGEQV